MSRFPAAFRLPAFASRSPCSRPGPGPSLRSAYRPPPGSRTRTGFPRSALTRYDRGGWYPLYPRDGGAHPRPDAVPGRRLPLPSSQSLHPATTSHRRATHHEASTRVHAIHPSGLPLTCSPRMGRGPSGFPLCSAPRCYQQRTTGRGRAISTSPELRDRHSRPSNPRVRSHSATVDGT